jgi:hypothetical protein
MNIEREEPASSFLPLSANELSPPPPVLGVATIINVLYLVGFVVIITSPAGESLATGTPPPPPPRLVFFAPYLVDIAC